MIFLFLISWFVFIIVSILVEIFKAKKELYEVEYEQCKETIVKKNDEREKLRIEATTAKYGWHVGKIVKFQLNPSTEREGAVISQTDDILGIRYIIKNGNTQVAMRKINEIKI